ncbi:uncharacterized protein [Littorina saxatilis]|uniref:Uncharacterized protein n=1 Tax=Littorina saxatilis TaxID=31220 RepID=A0AAN9AXE4_9CAEN
MKRMNLLCLDVLCLVVFAINHVSSSQEKGEFSSAEHASWLINQLREGDAQLKEQLKEGDSTVKELLAEGNARLKEQLVEDTARVKGLLNEEVSRLKKRLVEDVERVKEELKEGDNWMREQIAREATQTKKQLQEQQEAIEDFQKSMTETAKRNQAVMEQLTEKVTSLTQQFQRMSGVTDKMSALEDNFQSSNDKVSAQLESLQTQVDTATARPVSLQDTATHTGQGGTQLSQLPYTVNSTGSTFVRWGRTKCPDNAVLVYSGVAGGGSTGYTGSGANRLCLTMQPQFDNVTLPGSRDLLYGAEYDGIPGHKNWDVPCALCRAPHSTTIMVPATLTCPSGWTLQYTGHLAGHEVSMTAATEYVCLDAHIENRPGSANSQGADDFYYTGSTCSALPCPPYVADKVVTCVVCSL